MNSKKILQVGTGAAIVAAVSLLSVAPANAAEGDETQAPVEEVVETPQEVVETPAEETPAEEVPAEEAPVQEEAPAEETPAPEAPAPETPAEEPVQEETPAVETPAEETPQAETPEAETPAEETTAEETPAEETPEVTTPAAEDEEAPVDEETPAEDEDAEDEDAAEVAPGAPTVSIADQHFTKATVSFGAGDDTEVDSYEITLTDNFNHTSQSHTASEAGSYTFTGLVSGSNFTATVVAKNAAGESVASSTSFDLATGTPSTPEYDYNENSFHYGTIHWSGADATGAVDRYIVRLSGHGLSKEQILPGDATSVRFDGLALYTTYDVVIIAQGPGGEAQLNTQIVTYDAEPNLPSKISSVYPSKNSVSFRYGEAALPGDLSWMTKENRNMVRATYHVELLRDGKVIRSVTTDTFGGGSFKNLRANTTYTIKVTPENVGGFGESTTYEFTTAKDTSKDGSKSSDGKKGNGSDAKDRDSKSGSSSSKDGGSKGTHKSDGKKGSNSDERRGAIGQRGSSQDGKGSPLAGSSNGGSSNGGSTAGSSNGSESGTGNGGDTTEQLAVTGGDGAMTAGVFGGALALIGAGLVAARRRVFGTAK